MFCGHTILKLVPSAGFQAWGQATPKSLRNQRASPGSPLGTGRLEVLLWAVEHPRIALALEALSEIESLGFQPGLPCIADDAQTMLLSWLVF